jgi:hypothetical protein
MHCRPVRTCGDPEGEALEARSGIGFLARALFDATPHLSYDLPPADERKGKTKAESDRPLGRSIISHRGRVACYPAGTMADPRQKNATG